MKEFGDFLLKLKKRKNYERYASVAGHLQSAICALFLPVLLNSTIKFVNLYIQLRI